MLSAYKSSISETKVGLVVYQHEDTYTLSINAQINDLV